MQIRSGEEATPLKLSKDRGSERERSKSPRSLSCGEGSTGQTGQGRASAAMRWAPAGRKGRNIRKICLVVPFDYLAGLFFIFIIVMGASRSGKTCTLSLLRPASWMLVVREERG
jgi:hypothetical protein